MVNTPGYSKDYYWKNRDKILEQKRNWRFSNTEAIDKSNKKDYKDNLNRHLLKSAKRRAKASNLEFNISLEDIVIPSHCPILKKELVPRTRYAASLDRIDNSKGYIKGNVWVISWRANSMKNDATAEDLVEFREWLNSGRFYVC